MSQHHETLQASERTDTSEVVAVSQEEVPNQFFNGQALQQISRRSLIQLNRKQVMSKISKAILIHCILDILICAGSLYCYVEVLLTASSEESEEDESVKDLLTAQLCQLWSSVLLPFVLLKIALLLCKHFAKISTVKYKNYYKVVNGLQMFAGALLLVMQAFFYQYTLFQAVSKDFDSVSSQNFSVFFLYVAEIYIFALAICMIIYLGEITEWICKGCRFDRLS